MEETNNQEVVAETTKEMSFDELLASNPKYQSAFDKKVASSNETAINNAKDKWERDYIEKQSEAEKLSKMKDNEKHEYELEKERKARIESDSKLNAYLLKDEGIKIARADETKVDESLLDLIDFSQIKAEEVEPKIKTIKTAFDKAVERAVNERLKENTPKSVNNVSNTNKNISRSSY